MFPDGSSNNKSPSLYVSPALTLKKFYLDSDIRIWFQQKGLRQKWGNFVSRISWQLHLWLGSAIVLPWDLEGLNDLQRSQVHKYRHLYRCISVPLSRARVCVGWCGQPELMRSFSRDFITPCFMPQRFTRDCSSYSNLKWGGKRETSNNITARRN